MTPVCHQGKPLQRLAFYGGPDEYESVRAHDRIYVTRVKGASKLFAQLRDHGRNAEHLEADDIDYGNITPEATALHAKTLELMADHLDTLGIETLPGQPAFLAAKYAAFHHDPDFGHPSLLFCVTSLHCKGDLVFPNLQLRIPFPPGTTVAFDPLEPHGITERGTMKLDQSGIAFLSGDLHIGYAQAQAMGLADTKGLPSWDDYQLTDDGLWKRRRLSRSERHERARAAQPSDWHPAACES